MNDDFMKDVEDIMKKSLDSLRYQLYKIRTGRAAPSLLDKISIDYYGTPTPIKQIAQMSTPEARIIQIQPFDKTLIPSIEKSILKTQIGLNPSNDGHIIRLIFPVLTEESRKEQVKALKKMSEDAKVVIRNVRRDKNEVMKKNQKNKLLSEDQLKQYQKIIQKITDKYIKEVNEIVMLKEKELLTI